jgi:putative iron-only hydrogenase system regulator
MVKDNRLAVVGIAVGNREETASLVNKVLSDFGDIIVGRMGIPYKDRGISIISIIIDGTNDEIGAVTGKLGNIKGIKKIFSTDIVELSIMIPYKEGWVLPFIYDNGRVLKKDFQDKGIKAKIIIEKSKAHKIAMYKITP